VISNLTKLKFHGKALPFHDIYDCKEKAPMSAGQKFKCEICGKEFKAITNTHLKKHGMTTVDYRQNYPDAHFGNFDRFSEWRISEENRQNCQRMSDKVYGTPEIRERKAIACREATQKESYKKSQSLLMKKKIAMNPDKWPQLKSVKPTGWMKKSNYERWVIRYGIEEADKRQGQWLAKNILPSCSKNTKPELMFAEILNKLSIRYETQKPVKRFICDFYLPDHHLIVEIDGDYWHANPGAFGPEDLIGGKKTLAKEIWANDKRKTLEITEAGFGILRYWASELKYISHNKIFEDIVHASTKVGD
jgi:very-short-patch-repair endonuclease